MREVVTSTLFKRPLTRKQALEDVAGLVEQPAVRVLGEREGFLEAYARATQRLAASGSLVPDAHLVAILARHGVGTLYTADSHFRRLRGLDVRDPFET